MLKEKISSQYWTRIIKHSLSLICWMYLLIGYNTNSFSQGFNPNFNRILPNEGLIERHNEFIKKDSRGFVWISSLKGPYRFDGFHNKHYSSSQNNGLLGENIQSNFIEDKYGDIWFTTVEGINHYSRKKDCFDSYRIKNQNGSEFDDGYNLFHLEHDSILWLRAGKSIYRFDPSNNKQSQIIKTEGVRFDVDTFPNGKLKLIVACPWVSNSGVQFIHFNKNGSYEEKYFFKNGLPNEQNNPVEISKAIIESDSLVWLFSNKGILEFNPFLPDSVKSYSLGGSANDLLKDGVSLDDQYLLVGTKNSGLWIFNKKNKEFEKNITVQDNSNVGLSTNSLREIYLDDQDILWLSHFDEPAIDFTWVSNNEFTNPFDSIAGENPKVNSIIEDQQSRVWCTTEKNGVFVFHNKSLVHHYDYTANELKKVGGRGRIKQLNIDSEGRVWGISDHEIFYIHEEEWKKFYTVPYRIHCFTHSSNNSLILTTAQGIFQLSNKRNKAGKIDSLLIDDNSGFPVSKIFPSLKNRFFASKNGNKLLVYTLENNSYSADSVIIIGADIYDILEDSSENKIWISTSNGIWNLDLDSNIASKIKLPEEILENASITSYFRDELQNELFITNGNIWLNDFNKNITYRFRKEDGIQSGQFSFFVNLKDSHGDIWLGTNNGLLCFSPSKIKPYPYPSKIHLKNLKVNNNPVRNNVDLDEINNLEFNHKENSFEIEVLGITSYHPKLTQITYKLENYNSDWKTIPNNGVLQFTKIPPGKYKLKILSTNANNIKSDVRELEINILFPWWSKLWFKLACLIGVSLLGFGIFRLILNRKLAQQRLVYDALQVERNRIAGEMHDDLGSGLYSIKILLQGIQDKPISPEVFEKVNKVEEKTTTLVLNMREIIWAMDGGNDNLPDLIAYIRTFFLEFFDETPINAKAQIPENMPNAIISGKERRSVFLCVKEAVHNIAKHSNADLAEIFFKKNQKKLIIEIRDNGRGIDLESSNKFGNGLENMKKRMEDIKGKCVIKNKNGTKIILEIPIK